MLEELLVLERVDEALREAEKAPLTIKSRGHEKTVPRGIYQNYCAELG